MKTRSVRFGLMAAIVLCVGPIKSFASPEQVLAQIAQNEILMLCGAQVQPQVVKEGAIGLYGIFGNFIAKNGRSCELDAPAYAIGTDDDIRASFKNLKVPFFFVCNQGVIQRPGCNW
jgi:hypothetical protein